MLRALSDLSDADPSHRPVIGEIIDAAPDVAPDVFAAFAKDIQATGGKLTVSGGIACFPEDAGTVELTSAAAITSLQNGDYLFRLGEPGTCMEGLAALTPLTAPTSGDSFRGISRTSSCESPM